MTQAGVRVLHAGLKKAAGLHHLMARVMDRSRRVVEAPHQGILVGVPRHPREDLADPDPVHIGGNRLEGTSDLGRRIRLHVPGVQLAGTADQEEEDAVHGVLLGIDGPQGLQAEDVDQTESQPDSAPTWKKSRRLKPSQNDTGLSASSLSMEFLPIQKTTCGCRPEAAVLTAVLGFIP